MNLKALLPVSLLILLVSSSCQKEETADPAETTPAGVFGSPTTLNIAGVVVDEAGAPITGATVVAGFGSQSTTSDANGAFRIQGITGYNGLGLIRVSKEGYFPGSRSFLPAGSLNTVRVTLLTRQLAGTVDGSTGGEVSVQGATVVFGASSFSLNGAPYSGEVRVYIEQLDPTTPDFVDRMPGSLIALQDDALRALVSYGMMVVELTDDQGQRVELSEGASAEVRFPITANQQASAPSTIDLWWYDEMAGFWRHEGIASREGAEYVATVSHFSFWNCDMPFDAVQLNGNVYSGGMPVVGALVYVTSPEFGSAYDVTGPAGEFSGYVPSGENLSITISIECGDFGTEVLYMNQIGELNSNTNLGLINVTNPDATQVVGSIVNCEGNPALQGYIMVSGEAFFSINGDFSLITCSGGSIELIAVDPNGQQSSSIIALQPTGMTYDVGEIQACSQTGTNGHLNPNISYGNVIDQDGNSYPTITIGTQEWMAENLRVSSYTNGDPIPWVFDSWNWSTTNDGAYTHVDNNLSYNYPYGKWYNWYAISDARGVCPTGWHVPTDDEWKQLEIALGMNQIEVDDYADWRGENENIGGSMKTAGSIYWLTNETGTNESGFSAIGSSNGNCELGSWEVGIICTWWTSTTLQDGNPTGTRALIGDSGGINRYGGSAKCSANSVRCVRD